MGHLCAQKGFWGITYGFWRLPAQTKTGPAKKKGKKMEDKTIYQRRTIDVFKPIRNEAGEMGYDRALLYLARVFPINHPDLKIIFSLASYSMSNGLSEKQRELADKIILYHEKINAGIFSDPQKRSRRF